MEHQPKLRRMDFYCQNCGAKLELVKFCGSLWMSLLNCNTCGQAYLQIADPRWVYSLQFLGMGVLKAALSASDETLALAAGKFVFIDYKTVSVVDFEKVLLGIKD